MTPEQVNALGQQVDELGQEYDRARDAYRAVSKWHPIRRRRLWRESEWAFTRYMAAAHGWRAALDVLVEQRNGGVSDDR